MPISTPRIALRLWSEAHRRAFAAMHADPEVMADLGGPIDSDASDEKFERYAQGWAAHGISRWAIEDAAGAFVGYAGVMFRPDREHPLGPHHEIGWRLCRNSWGKGYASESARLALAHAWSALGPPIIFAYTAPDNIRSQAVMRRLALKRDASRDFETVIGDRPGPWRGWVWIAEPPLSAKRE